MKGYSETHRIDEEVSRFLTDRRARGCAPGTVDYYSRELDYFQRWLKEHDWPNIEDLSADVLRLYLIHLEEKGRNAGGQHAWYRAVKVFLRWWEEEAEPVAWRNPIDRLKPPKLNPDPLPGVDRGVFLAMYRTCDTNTFYDVRDRALFLTLYDTGVRKSELLAILIADLNLDDGSVIVRHGKGDKRRVVFVGVKTRRALVAWLRKHPKRDDGCSLFVTRQGTPLTPAGLRQMVINRAEKAGVPAPSIHAFRRAFALESLRNGMDVFTLQRLMGHASLTILRRYLDQTDEDLGDGYLKHSPIDNL